MWHDIIKSGVLQMKSILKIFIMVLFSTSLIKAQTGALPLIEDLESDSISYGIRELAIYNIKHNKLIEYVPYLDTSIFKQPYYYLVELCLKTLDELDSANIIPIAKAFIDSLDSPYFLVDEKEKINITKSRLFATEILFEHGDYSTAQYIFDYINDNRDNLKHYVFFIRRSLKLILKNVPSFAEQAKNELIYLAQNNSWDEMRWLALLDLNNVLGSEIDYLNVDRLINDEYSHNRVSAIGFLLNNNYPDLDQLIIERLYADTSRFARICLADTLLISFGTPSNYRAVKNYLEVEQNQIARSNIELSLEGFLPKPPYYLKTIHDYLDYIISICDTLPLYSWLGDNTFSNELKEKITTAKSNLQLGDTIACKTQLQIFQNMVDMVYKDSLNPDPRFVTLDGHTLLYWNAQYVLDDGWERNYWSWRLGHIISILQEPPANPNLLVNLKSSTGTLLTTGSLQYYEGSWKDAVSNGDGTFTVITNLNAVSLRMTYEYGSQQVNNITAHNNAYTFQTVNAAVQLKNSLGNLIDQGTVQYYAGAWRNFGTTSNGVATKELLPLNYSFRMTYEFASIDKQQDISTNPTVVFQTVNAAVQLKNSLGNLMPAPMGDIGTVQYYAGAWRNFGTTTNGVATKELLPINYSFRMTYAFASIDKQQNLSTDPTVVFQTVSAAVQLKNSLGNLIDAGTVQYYAGAWRTFGTTTNGVATKELLPINYSFRMTHAFLSKDKQQNLSTNSIVDFATVLCSVKVSKTNNQPLNNANVKYYAGAWRDFGATNASGITTKELLPQNISFRASYGNVSLDKQQDIGINSLVEILLNVP